MLGRRGVNQSSRCRGGHGCCIRVLAFFISFGLIDLSQALIITRIPRFLDRPGFILFMGFVLVLFYRCCFIHSIMGHRVCCVVVTPGV